MFTVVETEHKFFCPFVSVVILQTSHSAQKFYLFVVAGFFGECLNYFYYDFIRTEISPYLGSQSMRGSNFKSNKICIQLITFGFG